MTDSCVLPEFNVEQAAHFAQRFYALDGTVKQLDGERDLNFLITTERGKFVFKIANAEESPAMLECQHEVFQQLADARVFPQVATALPSLNGNLIEHLHSAGGSEHVCRVLPFIEGRMLSELETLSPELLADLGRRLALLDLALASYAHPALQRPLLWNMCDALPILEAYKPLLETDAQRDSIEHFEAGFRARVVPQQQRLRRSVVHNDANRGNVVVDAIDDKVISIIDFGDMINTWLVAEPAIAAYYSMLGKADPLRNAQNLIRAYHATLPLHAEEIDLLFDLICMRACMSVCICAHQRRLAPDNDYLSVDEDDAWQLLAGLRELSYVEARAFFLEACHQN